LKFLSVFVQAWQMCAYQSAKDGLFSGAAYIRLNDAKGREAVVQSL